MSLSFGDWPNYSSLANYSPWPHLSSYWSWALAYHLCGGKKSRVLHWKFNYHYLVYFVGLRKKVFHFIMQPNPKAVFCTSVLPLHLNSEHKISRTDILLLCYVIIYSCQWNHNESGNFTSEGRFFFFSSNNSCWQRTNPTNRRWASNPASPYSTWRTQQADTSFLCWALLICHFDSQRPQIHFSVKRPVQSHPLSRRQEMLENKSRKVIELWGEASGGWGSGFPFVAAKQNRRGPDENLSPGVDVCNSISHDLGTE